jgi:hypothetical protein
MWCQELTGMLEIIEARMDAHQTKADADRKTDKEEMMTKIDASQEEAELMRKDIKKPPRRFATKNGRQPQ